MVNSIYFISYLNATVTVVFSDRDCLQSGYNSGDLTTW